MGISNGWGYSAALAGINLFLWIVTIIKYRTAYLKNPAFSSRYIFVGFILILYSTFAFAEADTYHYEYIFNNMRAYQERGHIEVFYYWLSQIISNYYVWRIAIWGTAAWLIIQCCKRMNLNANIVGFLLPILFFRQFSLTRGTLGFALLMFCVVLLFNSSRYYLRSNNER